MSRRTIIVSDEKQAYEEKLNGLFEKYSRVLFCGIDNVTSQQIHQVRHALRGKAILVFGKKTLQRKIFKNRAERDDATENDKIFYSKAEQLNLLRRNTGLIFTNDEPSEVISILQQFREQAPARVNAIAPVDVIVPAGNTGMEPTQTSFFQAVGIATKITKGTVEIITDKKVLAVGDKVDNSIASLLGKLKISPFFYQVEVKNVWDRGVVFTSEDLAVTDDVIEKQLLSGLSNVAAVSLGAGIPTATSLPVVVVDSFKNLLAASIATGYSFPEHNAEETIKNAREGKLVAAAAAPAASAAPAAAAEKPKEEEPEEEDEDMGMGGLF